MSRCTDASLQVIVRDGCSSGLLLCANMMPSRRVENFKTLHGKHLHDSPVGFNVMYLFCHWLQI